MGTGWQASFQKKPGGIRSLSFEVTNCDLKSASLRAAQDFILNSKILTIIHIFSYIVENSQQKPPTFQ